MKNDHSTEAVYGSEQMKQLLRPTGTVIIGEIRDPACLAMMNAGCGVQFTLHRK
ncbi:hypothetical protein ACIFOE_04955 [Paenibacillus sp. NRS-1783]|uniref:hypothetical protein n=1 Tax=Paenibacillus sp. NRS-1783 TaxID=3233907 RepID=UPI003D293840